MQTFGCKNFRKFDSPTKIELGGINIFVGTNNSGKSTIIKGMILLLDNILGWEKNPSLSEPFTNSFHFDTESSSHLYLGGYSNSINTKNIDSDMAFAFSNGSTHVSFVLKKVNTANKIFTIKTPLSQFDIESAETKVKFHFCFETEDKGNVSAFLPTLELRQFLKEEFDRIDYQLSQMQSQNDGYKDVQDLYCELFNSWKYIPENQEYIEFNSAFEILGNKNVRFFKSSPLVESIREYGYCGDKILEYARYAFNKIKGDINRLPCFQYVEAHNATHKNFINIEDKDDFLSQTVSKFLREGMNKDEKVTCFVNKWLKNFKVADGYSFEMLYEDIVTTNLVDTNGTFKPLGSYGTGSIQMFILLLQIAIAMHSKKNIIVFVEEPEQNLHPALQSLLADLFYEVWKDSSGRIRLVVETHSEYLVRHLQVIVAKNIKQGDFTTDEINEHVKVQYFPEDDAPYSMDFDDYGYFRNDFGTGFFDQAGRSYRELIRMERGIK